MSGFGIFLDIIYIKYVKLNRKIMLTYRYILIETILNN